MTKGNKKALPARWEPGMQLENFFAGAYFPPHLPLMLKKGLTGWKPAIDMYESGKDVIVKADIPGCDKKDIQIKVDRNILTVSGEKKEEKEIKKKNFYQKEQSVGSFYRSISLPDYADVSNPKATYENGVLKISFPKSAATHIKQKRIEISGK